MKQGRFILPPISPLLGRRLLTALPTLFVIVTLTFILTRVAPGGPFRDEQAVPDAVRTNIEARYGLDRPVTTQYLRFWGNLLTGSLGPSFQQPERQALGVLMEGFGPSIILGLSALFIALLFGLGGGTLATVDPRTGPTISVFSLLALAIPVFVLGPLLIRFLAIDLRLFPAALWGSPSHLILPALTLGIPVGGSLARFWRTVLTENLDRPECLSARARGLSEWQVVRSHAGPRGLPLLFNYVGPMLAGLVTGSVVVEKIFGIPGMGRYFVDGALARDYPIVIGATLIYAIILLLVHTLADLSHLRLDPRLRKEHGEWTREEHARRRRAKEAAEEARAAAEAEKSLAEQALQEAPGDDPSLASKDKGGEA
ncbi:ABC transporter permease [Gemmatimonadota bacterium]